MYYSDEYFVAPVILLEEQFERLYHCFTTEVDVVVIKGVQFVKLKVAWENSRSLIA